jgi:hypothetical protein
MSTNYYLSAPAIWDTFLLTPMAVHRGWVGLEVRGKCRRCFHSSSGFILRSQLLGPANSPRSGIRLQVSLGNHQKVKQRSETRTES